MTTVNPDVFETISKAFYIVDKNDLRGSLQHVEIERLDDKRAVVTTSNGHTAFKKQIVDKGFMQIMDNSKKDKLYINADQWPALKLIAKSKHAIEVSYDNISQVLTTNIANVQFVNCSQYPDVKRAIQTCKGAELGSITFNMKHLEALCKALSRKSTKLQRVTLTVPKSERHVITVTSYEGGNEMGVIMPIVLPTEEDK